MMTMTTHRTTMTMSNGTRCMLIALPPHRGLPFTRGCGAITSGPARPAAPQRSVALPTPGAAGAQPQFYQTSTVPAQPASTAVSSAGSSAAPVDKPVHDETTRALFAHMWQSMKEV